MYSLFFINFPLDTGKEEWGYFEVKYFQYANLNRDTI